MRSLVVVLFCLVVAACGQSPSNSELLEVQDHHVKDSHQYPLHPELEKTPGELCSQPSYLRHPEQIPYCERDVSSSTKRSIIAEYDRDFDYSIGRMDRSDFKIDHFIPLCIGGSNSRTNLWPQHKSVFTKTDDVEHTLCQLMSEGEISQDEAVGIIRHVKFNINEAQSVLDDLRDR